MEENKKKYEEMSEVQQQQLLTKLGYPDTMVWADRETRTNTLIENGDTPYSDATKKKKKAPSAKSENGLTLHMDESMVNLVATAVLPQVQDYVDENYDIEGMIDEKVNAGLDKMVKRIEIKTVEGVVHDVGLQHYMFPLILKVVESKIPVFLVGPAGSGKTHIANAVCMALFNDQGKFSADSFCNHSSKVDLLGYTGISGEYVQSEFFKRFTEGGLWLGDEFDNGNANINNVLNSALANGYMRFPNGMAKKNDDFYCIVSGNTFGQGASRTYVGRNAMDAASLDRFAFIEMDYDEALEAAINGVRVQQKELKLEQGGVKDNPEYWVAYTKRMRKSIDSQNLRVVVSPRATNFAVRLSSVGVGVDLIEKMVYLKGSDENTIKKIKGNM